MRNITLFWTYLHVYHLGNLQCHKDLSCHLISFVFPQRTFCSIYECRPVGHKFYWHLLMWICLFSTFISEEYFHIDRDFWVFNHFKDIFPLSLAVSVSSKNSVVIPSTLPPPHPASSHSYHCSPISKVSFLGDGGS